MPTLTMFTCLVSLMYPEYPEVCETKVIEQVHEFSDVDYCTAVHEVLKNHEDQAEFDAAIAYCAKYDPDLHEARLNTSRERVKEVMPRKLPK